jgi:ribosomal protein S12 methylthiotransferase accessory factor YcaO
MKFQATVVFEFTAHDVAEAGQRVNALLEQAGEAGLETRSIDLSSAPGTPVTLPSVRAAR